MKNLPFYFIVLLVFMALSNELWSDGMFLDGIYYATISRNLSNGLGSFWYLPSFPFLSYSDVFHGHPPLAIGLQSICFSIFGDSIYIERAYSLFTFFITGFFIHLIWKEVMGKEYSFYSWVLLFFWAIIPLNSWACSNNFLENTMNIFVSSSVLFLIKNIKTNRSVYIIISAFCLFLAFLSKGFTGLFPLSFFFWYFLVFQSMRFNEMMRKTVLLVTFTLIPFLLLYIFYSPAIASLLNYIDIQVINSIQNVQTTHNRFKIVNILFNELRIINLLSILSIICIGFYIIFPLRKRILFQVVRFKIFFIVIIILAVLFFAIETYPYENPLYALYIYTKRLYYYAMYHWFINDTGYLFKNTGYFYAFYWLCLSFFMIYKSKNNLQSNIISSDRIRWIMFFILLALSGVIPMLISLKQSGVYILTVLPYFCISFVILIIPLLDYISTKISKKAFYFCVPIFVILFGPFISFSTTIKMPGVESWKLNSLKYQYERVGRDKPLVDDIRLIMSQLPKNTKLNCNSNSEKGYSILKAYFARYSNISLKNYSWGQMIYLVSFEDGWSYDAVTGEYVEEKTEHKNQRKYKNDYKKIELNTNKLHLYKERNTKKWRPHNSQ